MNDKPKNFPASVHARLLNIARERNVPFNLILARFGIERLLYRIAHSKHGSRFVLKGAMLFELWSDVPHRSTRDLDLLGFGDGSVAATKATFEDLCALSVADDGLQFDSSTIVVDEIKSLDEYVGTRVKLTAMLGSARLPLQIDIGIGDAIVPSAEEVTYPTLLDFPAPRLKAYSMETVIAEKLHAVVVHGMLNTRMKDFFDLHYLSKKFPFEGAAVRNSIVATFERRGTARPTALPLGLSAEFYRDKVKQQQWEAFLRKMSLGGDTISLKDVVVAIAGFIEPILASEPPKNWRPGGPWE